MNWNDRIRTQLPASVDDDVVEELAQHARALYDTARAEGLGHNAAEQRVLGQVAHWCATAPLLRRRSRRPAAVAPPAAGTSSVLASLRHDLGYAGRLLRRQPRFALLVIFTMALGIGTTTTLFSVTYGVLMKPLPWADSDRLVTLKETRGGHAPRFGSFSNAAYLAWREQASTIEEIGAWSARLMTVTGLAEPERVRVASVSPSVFRIIGARPLLGALFRDADDRSKVVVISEGLWRQRFAAEASAVGRSLHLDGAPYTIVGVLPEAQSFPDRQARAWVPFHVGPAAGGFLSMFEAIARIRPGVTPEQAASEGTARGRFAPDTGMTTMAIFGGTGAVEVSARPMRDALVADVRRPLLMLLAAVLLLLLIATSNVASLQLSRATARRREFAIRAALGASGGRLAGQLMIESVWLGVAGGAAGLALAWLLQESLPAILPADFPRATDLGIDTTVAAFASAMTLLASVAFGLAPALRIRRMDLVSSLTEDGVSPVGISGRSGVARTRLLIISGQVAIAAVLLVGAGLLGRSFLEMLAADRGYDARVLLSAIPMPAPGDTPQRRVAVMEAVTDHLRRYPGVQHVAFASEAPLTPGGSTSSFSLPSRDTTSARVQVQASPRLVSPGYFSTLGLRVIAGRPLEDTDSATSQPVVVVNETFARRYLTDTPLTASVPMGIWGDGQPASAAVVGVVEDVRYIGSAVTTLPEMYFSYRQVPGSFRSTTATLLVRSGSDSSSVATAVRAAVRQADPGVVPGRVTTMEERLLATSLARPRLYAVLLGAFAVVAVVVTGVGLFGVLSFTVAQRTRELGVRAALGARRSDLVALVVRQGLAVALIGVATGLGAAFWAARSISALLFGVSATDPLTYLVVAVALLVVATVACLSPALRAARLDPLRALRS